MRKKKVKFEEKLTKFEEKIRKVELLPTRDCEAGYGPAYNAFVKRHLEPTPLKSSPLFTFSTKPLGQDSPSVHLLFITIGSRYTTAKIKLREDPPS